MVFNSLIFLLFLAVVLPVYYRLQHRAQNIFLLLASWFFYGWWDWRFLGLLWFTSLFDYYCAKWIEETDDARRQKFLLAGSMAVNLTVLGVFKYFNFFAASAVSLLHAFGFQADAPTLNVVLPLGISFYTFLSMSYTIDVYRRELKATPNLVDYQLFVGYFPHLVAGPIVRASYLLPQCERPRAIKSDQVVNGVWLVLLGFFKKVVIGDRLAQVVNWGFAGHAAPFADANAWLVLYAFAFQIYADFSGYSDIARGLSKLMGFELVENFNAPYLVTNPSAFWRHWHISLSTWLRDYLYIPLGGNRGSRARTYFNLLLTMLLGGLWHGAGAAYLLWGFFHGALLAIQRGWQQLRGQETFPPTTPNFFLRALKIVLFFHVTCLGWLLFRAGSLPPGVSQVGMVKSFLHALFRLPHSLDAIAVGVLLLSAIGLLLQWKNDLMQRFVEWPTRWQATAVAAVLLAIAGLGVFEGAQFIYFQF
jgi:D-alanyl-lipoteichoic acid acyltransferase DltB (MBOAT superfamily)